MAYKSGVSFKGKDIDYKLYDQNGNLLKKEDLYVPHFREHCNTCGSKLICNGCSECGKCK